MAVEQTAVTDTWTTQVQINPAATDQELAESLRDQLGLMGWTPPWQFRKDSSQFQCTITHLAKTTDLQLDLQTGAVEVSENSCISVLPYCI